MQELPPLNTLKIFDSVARHESISRAALELNLTPGAITKQIQQLEEFLGEKLLIREHRKISLNDKGRQFQLVVSKAFLEMKTAIKCIKSTKEKNTVKIRSYTTFSIRWLIPRLSKFLSNNPEISLELTTSLDAIDFSREDIDCAIRLGSGNWPNVSAIKLIDNVIVPVCSPKYLQQKKIKTPKDLLTCELLHIKRRPNDWGYWFESCGLAKEPIPEEMVCENSEIAYAAAREGLGITMAQYFLVREEIELGKLVRPVKNFHDCGKNTYYLVMPTKVAEDINSIKFKNWILEEIKGSRDRP
jgi:LysR family glycine cleavage system transcriptional activator